VVLRANLPKQNRRWGLTSGGSSDRHQVADERHFGLFANLRFSIPAWRTGREPAGCLVYALGSRPRPPPRLQVHPRIVQERFGRSSIAITMDIYSHLMPNIQEGAAAAVDDAMRAAINRRSGPHSVAIAARSRSRSRPSRRLRLPDDGAERDRRAHPPEGHAGNSDDGRRARRLDARAVGRGEGAAAALARRRIAYRCTRRRQGRRGLMRYSLRYAQESSRRENSRLQVHSLLARGRRRPCPLSGASATSRQKETRPTTSPSGVSFDRL